MLEFNNEFFTQFVVDRRDRQGAGLIGEEGSVVSTLKMELQICKMSIDKFHAID